MRPLRTIIVLAGFVGTLTGSMGEVSAGEVVYKKHTVVDFGDDTIEGDLSKPDGAYLESRKWLRHQRLIKIRDNFRAEILQSVNGL